MLKVPAPGKDEVRGAVLVAEAVAGDHTTGMIPVGHNARDVLTDDLARGRSSQSEDIADSPIRALPHLLKAEFFNAGFVRSDGGAFDSDSIPQRSVGGINREPDR